MKLGYFAALCCFGIALLSAGLSYWDMQDGFFSTRLLYLPIGTGVMGLALLLFPGGHTTLQQAAQSGSAYRFQEWLHTTPALHRRVWLGAAALGIYLGMWAQDWLAGKAFFTLTTQAGLVVAFGLLWLVLGKQLRRLW